MNPLSLILGFLPLIAFNVLAGRVASNGIAWGALVALAVALINPLPGHAGRRRSSI